MRPRPRKPGRALSSADHRGVSLTERNGTAGPGTRALARGAGRWHPRCSTAWIGTTSPCMSTGCAAGAKGQPVPRPAAGTAPRLRAPWYLATSLPRPGVATAWYAQRTWLEATCTDAKSRFGMDRVAVSCPRAPEPATAGVHAGAGLVSTAGLAGGRRLAPGHRHLGRLAPGGANPRHGKPDHLCAGVPRTLSAPPAATLPRSW